MRRWKYKIHIIRQVRIMHINLNRVPIYFSVFWRSCLKTLIFRSERNRWIGEFYPQVNDWARRHKGLVVQYVRDINLEITRQNIVWILLLEDAIGVLITNSWVFRKKFSIPNYLLAYFWIQFYSQTHKVSRCCYLDIRSRILSLFFL